MTNAAIDQNGVKTFIGVLDTDGATVMRLYVDPTNGRVRINNGVSGTYPGGSIAKRDENYFPTKLGVSSADAQTLLKVLINSSHELMVKST